jgi:gentisate 1,2-dioxygenase
MPVRSTAMVFHQIEGSTEVTAAGQNFRLVDADTCCIPGYEPITLTNLAGDRPSFVFIADDAPLQKKLGVYEIRN